MAAEALVAHAQGALLLALLVSLPVVLCAAVVGLFVGAFQGATQIQDASVGHLPKMLAGGAALVLVGPWMGHQIAELATRMLSLVAHP